MQDFFEQYLGFDADSSAHLVLFLLCQSIVALFLLTLLFGLLTMLLRFLNYRHERLWLDLHALWDKDILNVLSGDASPAEFLRSVEPKQELNFVRFLAPYAYRLRGTDLAILAELARPYLPHVEEQLKHGDPGVRVWAVNILSLFGMPDYEGRICTALADKSSIVAMFAASTLLELKRAHYIEPVLDQFHRFEKWNTNSLASLLARIGGDEAIAALERVYLHKGRLERTRAVAAEALKRHNHYSVADEAENILLSEQGTEIVIATLHLLAGIGRDKHRATVRQLCSSPVDVIRINALRTLRELGIDRDRDVFRGALLDPNPWVARQAAWALRDLGDSATLAQLAALEHPRAVLARQVLAEQHSTAGA